MLDTRKRVPRLSVDVHTKQISTLPEDVRRGLLSSPKFLPPKHFYDDRGSLLFEAICKTQEYYPTRTEERLLSEIAEEVIQLVQPTSLVELGSGAAKKVRSLLEAVEGMGSRCVYIPFDVSETMLRESAAHLLRDFPWLQIHGVVGDYDLHLDRIPRDGRRLIAFLGGTIGNFSEAEAQAFLRAISRTMGENDRFLLGTDLVKDPQTLHRAYNDAQGLTAAFNKNILLVINRKLDADLDPDRFEHLAFFREDRARIEMHLRAKTAHEASIRKLGIQVSFAEGETILTEISRKFTKASVESLFLSAGLAMERWFLPRDRAFAIAMARRVSST